MKRTFTQMALAAAVLLCLSSGAYANGINTPAGVDLPIGAGGTGVNPAPAPTITITAPTATTPSRVGIWTQTPGYTLDVNGDTNIGGNLYVTGQQNTGARIFMQRDGVNVSWIGAQGTGADPDRDAIGFQSEPDTGKIDEVFINTDVSVNGGVKLGADSCDSSKAGTVSYEDGALMVCDGTSLKRITPTVTFYRFPIDRAYTGDQVCALHGGTCVSQGYGSSNYLFCGTAQSDTTRSSAGVECLTFN